MYEHHDSYHHVSRKPPCTTVLESEILKVATTNRNKTPATDKTRDCINVYTIAKRAFKFLRFAIATLRVSTYVTFVKIGDTFLTIPFTSTTSIPSACSTILSVAPVAFLFVLQALTLVLFLSRSLQTGNQQY